MLLIATSLNLPELGWDSHHTAAQGGWGWLLLLTKTMSVMLCVTPVPFQLLPLGSLWKGLRKAGMPLEVPEHCLQPGTEAQPFMSFGRLLAHTSCNKEGPSPPGAWRQSQCAASLEQNLQFSPVSAPSCSNNSESRHVFLALHAFYTESLSKACMCLDSKLFKMWSLQILSMKRVSFTYKTFF